MRVRWSGTWVRWCMVPGRVLGGVPWGIPGRYHCRDTTAVTPMPGTTAGTPLPGTPLPGTPLRRLQQGMPLSAFLKNRKCHYPLFSKKTTSGIFFFSQKNNIRHFLLFSKNQKRLPLFFSQKPEKATALLFSKNTEWHFLLFSKNTEWHFLLSSKNQKVLSYDSPLLLFSLPGRGPLSDLKVLGRFERDLQDL